MTPFLAGSALLAETAQFITVFLSQLLYQRAGLPVRAFGWLSMLATLCALAGARSHRLTRRLGRRRGGALLFLCAGAACLTALCPAPCRRWRGSWGSGPLRPYSLHWPFLSRTPLQSRAPGLRSSPATPWSWIWYPWS